MTLLCTLEKIFGFSEDNLKQNKKHPANEVGALNALSTNALNALFLKWTL